ncbi:MAG TPA: NAD-dependent epimerase/dehydratase family protein [Thermoleophilaceae bacterium]|nr:NAD-dependent epimerase/dehydratase family protein [Thermoleophilaceae bacterium]
MRRVLVVGGCGFVGSSVALALSERRRDWQLIAFDNLRRRGSELNLRRLREAGVQFVHGDVRENEDLRALEPVDAILECSAEPSVLAGYGSNPDYAVRTNLLGAFHCLELARRDQAQFVFLSTSRVYPIGPLLELRLRTDESRFELEEEQPIQGASDRGISERFPLEGARSIYGATKLSAELLINEYADAYGLETVIDRCGVIAGPWQMGKVDQGVFTHWVLSHLFGRELSYIGFGGEGRQVRDLLHVADLADLLERQLSDPAQWATSVLNIGGGRPGSLSLRETTELCRELTGRQVPVSAELADRPADVPIYLSDCTELFARTDWRPSRTPREILADIVTWASQHEGALREAL